MHIETDSLNVSFDGIVALDDVTVDFPAGSVTAIIGPNGAGKTTLFNVVAGFLQPDSGSVFLVREDELPQTSAIADSSSSRSDLVGLRSYEIALSGVGVLFQDVRTFQRLTALQNVAVGAKNQLGENPLNCLFRPKAVAAREKEVLETARQYLDYVGLTEKADVVAQHLSYGQQKLVAIARLLAGDARVLLLDEPTSGVDPSMIDRLLALIQELANNDHRAVVMIEHNLNVVKRVGDWVNLMDGGRIEVFGPPQEVLRDSALNEFFPSL